MATASPGPEMTGWELSRALRERDPDVTLAWITGWGEEIAGDETRSAGADAVLAKPFTLESLGALLEMASARRRARAA